MKSIKNGKRLNRPKLTCARHKINTQRSLSAQRIRSSFYKQQRRREPTETNTAPVVPSAWRPSHCANSADKIAASNAQWKPTTFQRAPRTWKLVSTRSAVEFVAPVTESFFCGVSLRSKPRKWILCKLQLTTSGVTTPTLRLQETKMTTKRLQSLLKKSCSGKKNSLLRFRSSRWHCRGKTRSLTRARGSWMRRVLAFRQRNKLLALC